MYLRFARTVLASLATFVAMEPALAHHLMGGRMPATFTDGLLSGLGHPIIGLDHFAAVVAVGCLAAAHRAAPALALAFVLAMVGGVALHVHGATMPGAEILVALSVIALGALMLAAGKCRRSRACVVRGCRLVARLCARQIDLRRRANTALRLSARARRHPKRDRARCDARRALAHAKIGRTFTAPPHRCRHCRYRACRLRPADHPGRLTLASRP